MTDVLAGIDPAALELLSDRAGSLAVEQEEDTRARTEVLVIALGDERYGIPVASVREVVGHYEAVPLPCAPDSVRGVVNLRGEIVSVMDLGALLQTGDGSLVGGPLVVIADESVTCAIVVDALEDVVGLTDEEVSRPLPLLARAQAEMVIGSFDTDAGPVALLDVSAMLVPIGGDS